MAARAFKNAKPLCLAATGQVEQWTQQIADNPVRAGISENSRHGHSSGKRSSGDITCQAALRAEEIKGGVLAAGLKLANLTSKGPIRNRPASGIEILKRMAEFALQ